MACFDYDKIRKWSKILTFLAGGGLIAMGIIRFITSIFSNPIYIVINIYLIIFGIYSIASEFEWNFVLKHFNLIRYFFGKAFFFIFLGFFCFGLGQWWEILIACIEWVIGIAFIILGIAYFASEKDYVEKEKAKVQGS